MIVALQFSCHGNSGSLEADPLAEFEAPCPQGAVGRTAGQDDCRRLVEKPSQMTIAASGYVAIVIDLSRLVAAGGQTEPGANRAGPLRELAGILNGGDQEVAVIAPTPGIDMRI